MPSSTVKGTTAIKHGWILDAISHLNCEGSLDSIHDALSQLSDLLKLDRCVLRNRIQGEDKFIVISEWYKQGLESVEMLEPGMNLSSIEGLEASLVTNGFEAVEDITLAPGYTPERVNKALTWGCRSFLILPLRYNNSLNGLIIAMQSKQPREWSDSDKYTTQIIGETALSVWLKQQSINELEKSRQQYQYALEASNDMLWDWNMLTGDMYLSPRFFELTGYEQRSMYLSAECLMSYIHPDDLGWIKTAADNAFESARATNPVEFRFITHSGKTIWVLSKGNIVEVTKEGRPSRAVGTYTDITVLKRTLQQFELSQQHAEENSEAKSQFLARMSHEVRTPLNAIIGMMHLLKQDNLNTTQLEKLRVMEEGGQQLLSVVNNVLDFSKIESGKVELDYIPFSLENVVQKVLQVLTATAEDQGLELFVEIATDVPDQLIGDANKLGQILTNLVSNAIKFTENGVIRLEIEKKRLAGSAVTLEFSLSDTGVGMNNAQTLDLFNPYVQAEKSIARNYGGSGLGLAICKSLVELMGGNIFVLSNKGKGSLFRFTIKADINVSIETTTNCFNVDNMLVYASTEAAKRHYLRLLSPLCSSISIVDNKHQLISMLSKPCDVLLLTSSMTDEDFNTLFNAIEARHNPLLKVVVLSTVLESIDLELLKTKRCVTMLAKPLTRHKLITHDFYAVQPLISDPQPDGIKQHRQLLKRRVLLVEDNHVNQMIASNLLKRLGMQVEIVDDGRLAFDCIYHKGVHFYDIVLMDIEMPVMNGHEATRLIRQLPAASDLAIIAMTANALSTDIQACIEAGLDAHIAKPIIPDDLLQTLLEFLD